MYQHYSSKFEKQIFILHPGEYYATGDPVLISTVLGSCIAVALYDPKLRFGGLNHFMLPGRLDSTNFMMSETGKYGMFAMELLINELIKMGARKERLRAKVFGGGHVLQGEVGRDGGVPQSNIRFAFDYLETENIPVESSDVGSTIGRKIFLDPQTFRVLLKRVTGRLIVDVEKEEEEYFERLRRRQAPRGDVTLFE
ncbi:MAG: chemotaxis protein CheD [Spirochaetaceae bacterium]